MNTNLLYFYCILDANSKWICDETFLIQEWLVSMILMSRVTLNVSTVNEAAHC